MKSGLALDRQLVLTQVTHCWTKILNRPVNPADEFFHVGGDSLKAIRMISEVQSTYDIEIDVEVFFQRPSLEKLVDIIIANSALGSVAVENSSLAV